MNESVSKKIVQASRTGFMQSGKGMFFSGAWLLIGIVLGWGIASIGGEKHEATRTLVPSDAGSSSTSPSPVAENSLKSLPYDEHEWELSRYMMVDSLLERNGEFEPEVDPVAVYLLRSKESTAVSGVGIPLYDMDLIVTKGGKVVYRFASSSPGTLHPYDDTSFRAYFTEGGIEIKTVTTSVGLRRTKNILFESAGFQGASGGSTYLHILAYDAQIGGFKDVSIPEFETSPFDSTMWFFGKYKGQMRMHLLTAGPDPSVVRRCHFCASPYRFQLYAWDSELEKFVVVKTFSSKNSYTDSSESMAYFGEAALMLGKDYSPIVDLRKW